jgi:WXG100 family type VII secretion target
MSVIRIEPAQVESSGSQFLSKRAELEALVNKARSLMNNLQATFTGQRATKIFGEWEQMQKPLQTAMQTLETTGNWLKKAAADFQGVDSTF